MERYCTECGLPYLGTGHTLEAAKALALELEGLNDEERQVLTKTLDDLVRDTPRTRLAVTWFKRLVAKAGRPARQHVRDIVMDIATDSAKKLLAMDDN